MKKVEAMKLVDDTFTQPYDEKRFRFFANNLFHEYEPLTEKACAGRYIPDAFKNSIVSYKRLAKFNDPEEMKVDVLAVKLPSRRTLENARTMQRNFIARYLNGSRGGALKDAALVAFYSDDSEDWRFSLVRMDYVLDEEKQKIRRELTPARRYSFLVGTGEKTHTARQQFLPVLQSPTETTLTELENAFNIETVTKEFFKQYKALYLDLRQSLDKHIKIDNITRAEFEAKNIDSADFAKRLLGQIVFLYFLQKKGWLGVERGAQWGSGPKDFLQGLYKAKDYNNFFNDVLEHLFYDALATERQTRDHFYPRLNCKIPFLNGGLFEPFKDYAWDSTDILLDDKIFKKIFAVFDLYNFTVREDEPLDKEVAVDPEMLGKVFENLIPENERKGSGTFYTPREIVHYMCQESLINYLDTELNIASQPVQKQSQQALFIDDTATDLLTEYKDKYLPRVPRKDISEFIYHGDTAQEHDTTAETKSQNGDYKGTYRHKIPETIRKHAREIDEALANVKICDPAIGSGAFLVGMMNEIVRARSALNAYLGDEGRTHYDFKRHAIQESVYGVDIEPSAVDIAKLRLWLSLIVDEVNFGIIKPLPNLEYKIISGNSLFGVEKNLLNNGQFIELEELKDRYFYETRPSEKKKIKDRIHSIQIELQKDNHFSFEISFSEVFRKNRGFDISIANPPYIFARESKDKGLTKEYKDYFYKHYELSEYQVNLYPLFVELSTNILRRNGILCYITPNNWMTINTNKKIRKLILNQSDIIIVNFYARVFETASVDSSIIIFRKGNMNNCIKLYEYENSFNLISEKETEHFKKEYQLIINIEALKHDSSLSLISKVESNSAPLSSYATVKVGLKAYQIGKGKPVQTKKLKNNRKYHSKNKIDETYIRYLQGRDVSRYYISWSGEYLKYGVNLAEPRKISLFDSPRILVRQIPSKPPYCINACFLEDTILNDLNSMNIVGLKENPYFLLSMLNSRIVSYWFIHKFGKMQRGIFPQFKVNELKIFPIINTSDEGKQSLIGLSQKIVSVSKNNSERSIQKKEFETLNHKIDQIIYRECSLTEEEIAIVEGAAG